MGCAHRCDHGKIGTCSHRQSLDLSKAAHTHLQYRIIGFGRDFEQGKRHSDHTVEIPLGLKGVKALSEHRRDHILCRGLSNASRNGNRFA